MARKLNKKDFSPPHPADRQDTAEHILLHHVRVNNLKDIDLEIPPRAACRRHRREWLREEFAGLRYTLCRGAAPLCREPLLVCASVRRAYGKPEADWIRGCLPRSLSSSVSSAVTPRSTVATSTEIYEYLRLLYARVGHTISPTTGEEVRKHTVKDVLTYIKSLPIGSRVYLIVPLHIPSGRSLAAHLEIQLQQGV